MKHILPTYRSYFKMLLALTCTLGMSLEMLHSFPYPYPMPPPATSPVDDGAADRARLAREKEEAEKKAAAAAAKKAKETVDSAGNLPSINNATREGSKATAGAVQTGLKGKMKFVSMIHLAKNPSSPENRIAELDVELKKSREKIDRLTSEYESLGRDLDQEGDVPLDGLDKEIKISVYNDVRSKLIKASEEYGELDGEKSDLQNQTQKKETGKKLKSEQKKLNKKKAKLEKKKKKQQAELDGVDKDLDRLNKKGPPESEIGKAVHEGQIKDLERKQRNIGKDLKKIEGEIKGVDGKLNEIGGQLKNISSTLPANRPEPSPSLVRYFQFMGDLHVDYRVALGMSEGREETIDLTEWMAASYLDTSAGHPFAMIVGPSILASGASEITVVVPSGEISSGKDVAVEAAPVSALPADWEIFISGSFSRYDQNSLSGAINGFQSDTWTGTLGLEYQIDPSLMVGIAYSYAETDTTVDGGQGDIDLSGSVVSAYVVKNWNALSSGLLYSYGSYQNDVTRSTGIGSPAQGSPDSDSNTISWMLDYALVRSENLVMGPSVALDYGEGGVDGYRERGAGAGNLNVAGTSYETMISSIGWEIDYAKPTDYGQLICNVYAGWEHEYMPEDSPLTASLATTPAGLARGISPGITANGAHPGTDWLGLGVNVQLLTTGGWNVSVGYYGQLLRQDASSHTAMFGFSKSF